MRLWLLALFSRPSFDQCFVCLCHGPWNSSASSRRDHPTLWELQPYSSNVSGLIPGGDFMESQSKNRIRFIVPSLSLLSLCDAFSPPHSQKSQPHGQHSHKCENESTHLLWWEQSEEVEHGVGDEEKEKEGKDDCWEQCHRWTQDSHTCSS